MSNLINNPRNSNLQISNGKLKSYVIRNMYQNPVTGLILLLIPTGPHVNTCFYSVNGLQIRMEKEELLALD